MTTSNGRHAHGHDGELTALADIVRREVRREMRSTKETTKGLLRRGRRAAHDAGERVSGKVRERPLTSLAVAGGIGLLLGILLGRRR